MHVNLHAMRGISSIAVALALFTVNAADAAAQIATARIDSVVTDPCVRGGPSVVPRFIVSPYGWTLGISGPTGIRDRTADVDITFSELLDKLRFAAMAGFEADYGPWIGAIDLIYASVRDDRTRSIGPLQADLTAEIKLLISQALVGYSFLATPTVAIDVLAGARFWAVDASLLLAGERRSADRERDPRWADALGALRVRWSPAVDWQVSAYGDAGGGGSKGTGQAAGTVGYDISSRWTLFATYRWLKLDYRKNDYFFDAKFKGPLIGGAYRW